MVPNNELEVCDGQQENQLSAIANIITDEDIKNDDETGAANASPNLNDRQS